MARRGLTWRSWKSASCLRRKRFSAASVRREWTVRTARRSRSATTGTIVRKQCATGRKSDKLGINAQDGTLQNVTGFPCGLGQNFCGLPAFSGANREVRPLEKTPTTDAKGIRRRFREAERWHLGFCVSVVSRARISLIAASPAGVKRKRHSCHNNSGLEYCPKGSHANTEPIRRSSGLADGLMFLFRYLGQPRIQMLHGADIVGLTGCGACLGVGIVGLIGLLRLPEKGCVMLPP